MVRPKDEDGPEREATDPKKVDLLSELFVVCSDKIDDNVTISIDWSDHFAERSRSLRNAEPQVTATKRAKQTDRSRATTTATATTTTATTASAATTTATLPSVSSLGAARVPLLSRATSQGAYFNGYRQSLDPDHTVGRTRVPWHAKWGADRCDAALRPTRIVAFDVSGKLFRCKESLIAQYPLKRLHQIITCPCGKVGCLNDAFSIDRNPQHFEMILDWYRTGKLVRQRNVDEDAFKDDAMYFDLYDELFPTTVTGDPSQSWATPKAASVSGLPARRRSANDVDLGLSTPQRVSMFANMPSTDSSQKKNTTTATAITGTPTLTMTAATDGNSTEDEQPEDVGLPTTIEQGPLRFFRRERRELTAGGPPLVFTVRKFEHLVVERVRGRGKLLVRVADGSGLQAVGVSEAVLYDSHARSYSKEARGQLQPHTLLPGDHVYTFWVETNASDASVQTSAPLALDIEFKLLFTFDPVDRLTSAMEVELLRATAACGDAICALTTAERPSPPNWETDLVVPRPFVPQSPLQATRGPQVAWPPTPVSELDNEVSSLMAKRRSVQVRGDEQDPSSSIRHAAVTTREDGHLTASAVCRGPYQRLSTRRDAGG